MVKEWAGRIRKVIVRYYFNELNTDFNKTLHSEGIGRRITSFCLRPVLQVDFSWEICFCL
jgi:hypothetical protein